MRISNCIDCKEYKYLVRNGKCRNCISSELYLGTDKKGDDILIKKSQIYKNINISGVTGTGRTTMALNICRQFNNEHGIIYFNFKDELDKQKFDAETICIGKSDMFHLFNTIRDKKDNNYLKEINETSYLYSHIIVNNCDSHIGPTDVRVLGAIITFLFDSNKNLSFADLYKCVSDLNFRRNLIHNTNKKLKNKSLCKVMDYEFESKFQEDIKKLCKDIPNSKNKIKISDIITNNKNVVINFEPNLSKKIIPLLTVLNMNKIFKHLELKNKPKKYKSIFVLDGFEILKDYKDEIERIYINSKKLNMSIINICEYPSLINTLIFNNIKINIAFKLNDKRCINKIFGSKNYKNIMNLNNYHYMIKTHNKIYQNCTLKNI